MYYAQRIQQCLPRNISKPASRISIQEAHTCAEFVTLLFCFWHLLPFNYVTPLLQTLHWLPVEKRIDLKLASLCFKSLNGSAPTYLSDLLHLYTPSRQLRSSADTRVFRIPSFRTKSSDQRCFSYQAPATWNKLPASIRHASSVSSFKSSLKTFLFLNFFFQSPCPEMLVYVKVCLCVCVPARTRARVCVCVCVRARVHVFAVVYLNFWQQNTCTC